MRVKIIKNAFSGELEEEINKFISNDDIILKDVKYCVSNISSGEMFSALIIYEERGKQENKHLDEVNCKLKRKIGQLEQENEKLQNNRDKAIEFLKTEHMTYDSACEWRQALINILKGGSAEAQGFK